MRGGTSMMSMRGRGGFRGNIRGTRGGITRGGAAAAAGSANPNSYYEDVYEPAPQQQNIENGSGNSGVGSGNISYFEEFPEPGNSNSVIGSSRSNQSKSRFNHIGSVGSASTSISNHSHVLHQKAF